MKTVYDLETELKRLRSRVRQLECVAVPSEDKFSAIVEQDPYDDKLISQGSRGGFAAAVTVENKFGANEETS